MHTLTHLISSPDPFSLPSPNPSKLCFLFEIDARLNNQGGGPSPPPPQATACTICTTLPRLRKLRRNKSNLLCNRSWDSFRRTTGIEHLIQLYFMPGLNFLLSGSFYKREFLLARPSILAGTSFR